METTHKLGMNDNNSKIENGATIEPIRLNGQLQNGLASTTPAVPVKPSRYMIHVKPIGTTNAASSKLPASSVPNGAQNGNAAPVVDKAEVFENDEIEFLLEEIRDLEIPACRTDSEREDFEIAGSRADLDLSLHLDSPVDTSWYYFSIINPHDQKQRECSTVTARLRVQQMKNNFFTIPSTAGTRMPTIDNT